MKKKIILAGTKQKLEKEVEIQRDYEAEKLEREVTKEEVETTIKACFPKLWNPTKIALSTICVLLIEDSNQPLGINFIGSPSSGKGTTLSFFYPINPITYHTDEFSPQSFVSHYASVTKEQLGEIDLLPRIKNKCLIVPELAPIFGARKDDRLKNISILTRVFDGQGLSTDSGVHGKRGYFGDYMFTWLGASTPFSSSIWRLLEKLGQRWLFYNMDGSNKEDSELLNEIIGNETYIEKIKKCHEVINNFLKTLWNKHGGIKSIKWVRKEENQVKIIIKLAKLLVRLRAYVLISSKSTESGESVFYYTIPMFEDPERVMALLYELARGHAIWNDRMELIDSDLSILIPIVLSSAPYERTLLIDLLLENDGTLYSSEIQERLNCSQGSASRMMKMFEILGICDKKSLGDKDSKGRPLEFIELKKEFSWFLGDRFKFLKKGGQTTLTHNVNSVNKNNIIHKNDGVQEENHSDKDPENIIHKNDGVSEDYDFNKECEKIAKWKEDKDRE